MNKILEREAYKKVGTIDNVTIYKDENGYFTFEHYVTADNWYSLKQYLGKNHEEVQQTLADLNDWNYRAWHGEMKDILLFQQQVKLICRGE